MSRPRGIRRIAALVVFLLPSLAARAFAANDYQIDLSVDPARGILHGQEKVTYRNETEAPLDTLFLDAPGEPGAEPAAGNERWRISAFLDAKGNKVNLTWKPDEEAYAVTVNPPLGAGFKTTFTIEYERSISPGDRAAGYLDLNDRGPQAWFLKFRAYRAGSFGSDDFKDISVSLAPPAGWALASTGAPASGKGAAAGKSVLSAKGVRNFALALGEGFASIRGTAGSVPVAVFHPPGQDAWGRAALAETVDAISYYAAFLGAYPPPAVSVLPSGPGAGQGASSSQVIYLPPGSEGAELREAASLQAAQLVWGWSVGDPSDTTPFVANGLAAWCQHNYLAKRNNTDLHTQYLASGINDTYLAGVNKGYDTTLLRTRAERKAMDWDFERIVARAKSAAVMHMLGGILGAEKLQEVARGIVATSRGKIFTDRDFQKAAQAATSFRLDGFFDQFLRSKDYLDYYLSHVRTNPAPGGGFEVRADVFKTGPASMPVEVVVEDTAGTRVRSLFPADRASGEMAIPIKAPLAAITLDPLNLLPLVSRVGSRGHLDLAEMQIAEGRLLRADEQVDQALSDAPGDPRAWLLKGRILKERGDWAGGIKMWERAVSLASSPTDPSRLWSQIWIARVYDLQGKRSEATALYTQVAGAPDRLGSRKAAEQGAAAPYADTWPPRLP